jgi:hypothetical protein
VPASRAALIRRDLRRRFGIASSQVSVRSTQPWYLRVVFAAVVATIALAAAGWIFETGMRLAGHERAESTRTIIDLQARVANLERDNDALQRAVRASESRIEVERVAQESLALQLRSLQQENAALKEDVALFEGFVSGASITSSGPRIVRVAVEPIGEGGRFKYRLLLFNRSAQRGGTEFRGQLQFDLLLEREGRDANIRLPESERVPDVDRYRVVFRHFHRVEGEFVLPSGASIKGGEVRLLRDGNVEARMPFTL